MHIHVRSVEDALTNVLLIKLGNCFQSGIGVTRNFKRAVEWYTKASDQGSAYAQNILGDLYRFGFGITYNFKRAVELYTKASEQGNIEAYFNLGLCYEDGVGVDKDMGVAIEMFTKAVELGHKDAQQHLDKIKIKLPEPPTYFICPITRDLLKDPVCAPDGYTYERVDIEKWLSRQHNSPFTREPMSTRQLIPNRKLKEAIEDWKKNLK